MEANHRGSYDINYSLDSNCSELNSKSAVVALSRRSYHSTGEDITGSTGSVGLIRHSDTQFDSSADETVVPYMIGESASQKYISTTSIGAAESFDPEASPKSHLSRATRRSIDTDQCGTLYEETLQIEPGQLLAAYNQTMADAEIVPADGGIEQCDESQRLVSIPTTQTENSKPEKSTVKTAKADYRVGSCYHCMINVPPGSLTAWILVFISIIGWATSSWLSLDNGKDLLKWIQSDDKLTYEEMSLIGVSLATAVITAAFLIIATFSSQKMSRYSFASSKKNNFGYCLSVTVIVLSFMCVLFWTAIVGLTMVPVAVLAIAHILLKSDSMSCLHLQSYGIGAFNLVTQMNSTTTTAAATTAISTVSTNGTSVGVKSNMTTVMDVGVSSVSSNGLVCGDELDMWMEDAWRTLVPLLISLGFALAIECCMLGFLVAASSNARHLKERMEYINEPYNYSAENVNGSVKPVSHQDKTQTNNNQGDTQI